MVDPGSFAPWTSLCRRPGVSVGGWTPHQLGRYPKQIKRYLTRIAKINILSWTHTPQKGPKKTPFSFYISNCHVTLKMGSSHKNQFEHVNKFSAKFDRGCRYQLSESSRLNNIWENANFKYDFAEAGNVSVISLKCTLHKLCVSIHWSKQSKNTLFRLKYYQLIQTYYH